MNNTHIPIVMLQDDAEVKALLVEHGCATSMEPRLDWPKPFRIHNTWSRAGQVYVVTRFYGYDCPEDNGYRAFIFPLAFCTKSEAESLIKMLLDHGADKEGWYYSEMLEKAVSVN